MPGENPDPNLIAAEVLGFGYNLTGDRTNSIKEFSADSAASIVTEFHKKAFLMKLDVKWNPDQFPT